MNHSLSPRSFFAVAAFSIGIAAIPMLSGCPGTLDLQPYEKAAAAPVTASSAASSGSGSASSGGPPPVCDAPTEIFTPTCAVSGCHSNTNPASGLDLSASGLSTLLGRSSSECTGFIIDPATPANSLLYTKVLVGNTCFTRMPYGGTPLTSAQEACILSWVTGQVGNAAGAGGSGAGGSGNAGSGGSGGAGGG